MAEEKDAVEVAIPNTETIIRLFAGGEYRLRYGAVLNMMFDGVSTTSACTISLSRLLHVFANLQCCEGYSAITKASRMALRIGLHNEPSLLNFDKVAKESGLAGFSPVDRYEEITTAIANASVAVCTNRSEVNKVKRKFIEKLGHNNSALLFNQGTDNKYLGKNGEPRKIPRKYEVFNNIVGAYVNSMETGSNRYLKLLTLTRIIIPGHRHMEHNAALLEASTIPIGDATRKFTLLRNRDSSEYFVLCNSYNLVGLLATLIPVNVNETALENPKVRESLNIIIDSIVATMRDTAGDSFASLQCYKECSWVG